MAGASITIDIDNRQVLDTLNQLARSGANLEPALREIGEALVSSTKDRFAEQQAPDGMPWAPLSQRYKARKKKNKDQILVLEGHLHDLIRYQASDQELRVGTDRIYGATHQFGAPDRGIPARPFLGLSEDDRAMVLEVLQECLLGT